MQDLIVGSAMVLTLGAALAYAAAAQNRALQALEDKRAACRISEEALLALRQGQTQEQIIRAAQQRHGVAVAFRVLEGRWIAARVQVRRSSAELVGLNPETPSRERARALELRESTMVAPLRSRFCFALEASTPEGKP